MPKVNAASLKDSAAHYEAMAAAHASPSDPAEAKKHATAAANAAAELESIDPRWLDVQHIDLDGFCATHGIKRPRRPALRAGRNKSTRAVRSSRAVRIWLRSSGLATAWAGDVNHSNHLNFALAAAQVRAAAQDADATAAARATLEHFAKSENTELLSVLRAHPNYRDLMPKAA